MAHGQEPPRVHDLIALNQDVEKADDSFSDLADDLEALTPYSVLIRYPGASASPDDARKARDAMRELRARIRRLLDLDATR